MEKLWVAEGFTLQKAFLRDIVSWLSFTWMNRCAEKASQKAIALCLQTAAKAGYHPRLPEQCLS